jgi:hypothetical protein
MLAMLKTVETGPAMSLNASPRTLAGDEEWEDLNAPGPLRTAAGHHDFTPGDSIHPDPTWRPPYPYGIDECLWTRP